MPTSRRFTKVVQRSRRFTQLVHRSCRFTEFTESVQRSWKFTKLVQRSWRFTKITEWVPRSGDSQKWCRHPGDSQNRCVHPEKSRKTEPQTTHERRSCVGLRKNDGVEITANDQESRRCRDADVTPIVRDPMDEDRILAEAGADMSPVPHEPSEFEK